MVGYLLEAATRVYDREGIEATTNRIADEAGVSIGSLYQYFADKHALMEALALRHLDEAEEVFAAAFAGDVDEDLRSFVTRLVEAAVRLHSEHGRLHQTMREHAPRTPAVLKRFTDVATRTVQLIEKKLSDLEVDDPAGRAQLAFSTVDAQVHGLLAEATDEETHERHIALVVDQLLALLTPTADR